jgi:hypothetical protein
MWRLGFTGAALAQSTPGTEICQVERRKVIFVPSSGCEVFLPALDPERVYEITVEGLCQYVYDGGWWIFSDLRRKYFDPLYCADSGRDFVRPHDWLALDGVPLRRFMGSAVPETMPREDRELHRYSLRIDGESRKLAMRLSIASKNTISKRKGKLKVTIETLPKGTPSPLAAFQAREALKEAERLVEQAMRLSREEAERRAEELARLKRRAEEEMVALVRRSVEALAEARDREAREKARLEWLAAEETRKRGEQAASEVAAQVALESKLESLRIQAHWDGHFLDQAFQLAFAKQIPENTLKTLKAEWRQEYAEFMRNVPLTKLAEEKAPKVIEWYEAQVRIIQLAEQWAVVRAAREKKQGLMLDKEATQIDETIARAKLRAKKIVKAKSAMDTVPLDDDEKEFLKGELVRGILEAGEENQHGKNGDTL